MKPAPPVTIMRRTRSPFESRVTSQKEADAALRADPLLGRCGAGYASQRRRRRLSLDARMTVAAGLVALCAFAFSGSCRPRQFRALLLVALVAAAIECRSPPTPSAADCRTAHRVVCRYDSRTIRNPGWSSLAPDDAARSRARYAAIRPRSVPRVVVRGRLAPFDDARNPGEPSERAIQRERGIDAQLEAATVLSTTAGSPWDSRTWLAQRARMGSRATAPCVSANRSRRSSPASCGASGRRFRPICAPSSKKRARFTCWSPPDCTSVPSSRSRSRSSGRSHCRAG